MKYILLFSEDNYIFRTRLKTSYLCMHEVRNSTLEPLFKLYYYWYNLEFEPNTEQQITM